MNDATPQYATIPGFEQLTAQEVFDISVNHLRKQGTKSRNSQGMCLYRAADGSKCAAGPLLREEAVASCENNSWYSLAQRGSVPEIHRELVSELQATHDGAGRCDWEEAWQHLASRSSLIYTPLTK